MTKGSEQERRLSVQDAAIAQLMERVTALEEAMAFEISQRGAMEKLILHMADLPRRMKRVEFRLRSIINRRRSL